ncbi:hypothetical protein [Xenorhabdus bovienii]|uniref:hypothetical protein n=1 Tax=Xenorhabdus bovienii TaxID=40576 RepID=UPI00215880BC|nr:hypothetical protein [Xenorhabdus bovienii]
MLREELFTVQVTDLRQHPKSPTLLREEILTVCEAPTITEAVQLLKVLHLLGDWPLPETFSHPVQCAFFR